MSAALWVYSLLALVGFASASPFLGRASSKVAPRTLTPELQREILSEIEAVLGHEHGNFTERRLRPIEETLQVTYAALPKNEHQLLGHAAASYALHRLFMVRHGWSVWGLDPEGTSISAWNSSTAAGIFEDGVLGYVFGLFEQRLGGRGFSLRDISILAAALELLVHQEALARLLKAFRVNGFSIDDAVNELEAEQILDTYMAIYIMESSEGSSSEMSNDDLLGLHALAEELYPAWNKTKQFVREVKKRVMPTRDYFFRDNLAVVVEEIGEMYGRWQNEFECQPLKKDLLESEDAGPGGAGRVRLADFYKMALHEEMWQFSESLVYLRHLGAIDDSDPQNVRVIIPNYISSPTNCVDASSYYMVCCIDECEGLLASIERTFSKPELSPEEVATHVAILPSSTVPGNRTLSAWLLRRLHDVAEHHHGSVPLHGRLFAQWMHYAYPRECKYPHVSGTTDPLNLHTNDPAATATEEEMRQVIDLAGVAQIGTAHEGTEDAHGSFATMWTMEEELVAWRPAAPAPQPQSAARQMIRAFGLIAVFTYFYAVMSESFSPWTKDRSLGKRLV